ncbi:MAG TPA: hypothetical protein VLH56_18860 [Dissulfurispiraceae bacterium]|nr:hypothetical protein [Dissulfurispiraceae bacterium]
MILRFSRSSEKLTIDGTDKSFRATNEVRNELNGRRRLHDSKEVVKAVVNGQWGPPYMPRQFPLGVWNVLKVAQKGRDTEFWPVRIETDATQMVHAWELDAKGGYASERPVLVEDSGYHLHWTPSKTTLGCIRIGGDASWEMIDLADVVWDALKAGDKVQLIVEE